ncbi:MAG: hypothetical protein PIR53_04645 [Nocardioides alkalitolerans]
MPLADDGARDGARAEARAEAVHRLLPAAAARVRVLGDQDVAHALTTLLRTERPGVTVLSDTPSAEPSDVVVLALAGPGGAGVDLPRALDRLRAGGLPPGGTLLVCVDPVLGPDVHAELLAGTAAYAETVTIGADGVHRRTTHQLRRLLERHGFAVTGRCRVTTTGDATGDRADLEQHHHEPETDQERIRGAMPELSDDENTAETVVSATPAAAGGAGRDEEWQQLFDSRERLRAQVAQLERELETVRSLLVAERAHFQSELRLGAAEVSGMQSEIERHLESRVAIQKQLDKWQREYERLVSVDGKPLAVKVAYRRARRRAADVVRSDPRLERAARRVLDRVRSR